MWKLSENFANVKLETQSRNKKKRLNRNKIEMKAMESISCSNNLMSVICYVKEKKYPHLVDFWVVYIFQHLSYIFLFVCALKSMIFVSIC